MNTITVYLYWIIVAFWGTITCTGIAFYSFTKYMMGTTRLLLAALVVDAARSVIENAYFASYFSSKFGIFPASIYQFLGQPHFLILPKIANIGAGSLMLYILFVRWLPAALQERREAKQKVEHLLELATTDCMTGLRNRREFMSLADMEWQRSLRYHRNLSMMVFDIDSFKLINDRHGHQVGDEVMIAIARLCKCAKRTSDTAGRIGGDEFAILLPETSLAEAYQFAERLRQMIASEVIAKGLITTTISIGLSNATNVVSLFELLKQADVALYQAKGSGRNKVCMIQQPAQYLTAREINVSGLAEGLG